MSKYRETNEPYDNREMKEYIKVLEVIKQQYESALDDGQNSTDKDAIEAVEDNALAIEALNMATQALIDFPTMLNQYLGENDQMIIGKNVCEELKYELETLKKSVESQEWISVKDSRKPKIKERVWVTDCDGEVWIMYYNDCDCYFNAFGDVFTDDDIIAWQPITEPSPYKGE